MDFRIKPLPRSKFSVRVRVWPGIRSMARVLESEGGDPAMTLAAHHGERRKNKIGDIYLHLNPSGNTSAFHELTHAAVYYVTQIRRWRIEGDPEVVYVTKGEELLADVMELYVKQLCIEMAKR